MIKQINAQPIPAPMKGKGYPHIVVSGNTKKDPKFYYIRIENLVFPVSYNQLFYRLIEKVCWSNLNFPLHALFSCYSVNKTKFKIKYYLSYFLFFQGPRFQFHSNSWCIFQNAHDFPPTFRPKFQEYDDFHSICNFRFSRKRFQGNRTHESNFEYVEIIFHSIEYYSIKPTKNRKSSIRISIFISF